MSALKGADSLLGPHELEIQSDGFPEEAQVVLSGKPGGEITGLVLPMVPYANWFKTTES